MMSSKNHRLLTMFTNCRSVLLKFFHFKLSLAIPSWVGAMSTSQRACGWAVKAGMVGVWVAGKTV